MVTLEQKLSLFKKHVTEKVKKQTDELIAKKEQELQEAIASERLTIQQNADRVKRTTLERIKRQKSESISTIIQQERKKTLRLMEEHVESLLTKVEGQVQTFIASDQYPAFIKKTLATALENFDPAKQLLVTIVPAGYDKTKQAIAKVLDEKGYQEVEYKEGQVIDLGGYILENQEQTIRINKTFAEAIHLKKEEIGQLLHEYLKRED